jgi:tyrosyl-tRNA synthetase
LLAEELITRFHSRAAAAAAQEDFITRFQKGALPDDMPELEVEGQAGGLPIANLLKNAGLVDSTSDAFRMIQQGAVKIDGNKVEDRNVLIEKGSSAVFQVGKRKFARVSVK